MLGCFSIQAADRALARPLIASGLFRRVLYVGSRTAVRAAHHSPDGSNLEHPEMDMPPTRSRIESVIQDAGEKTGIFGLAKTLHHVAMKWPFLFSYSRAFNPEKFFIFNRAAALPANTSRIRPEFIRATLQLTHPKHWHRARLASKLVTRGDSTITSTPSTHRPRR